MTDSPKREVKTPLYISKKQKKDLTDVNVVRNGNQIIRSELNNVLVHKTLYDDILLANTHIETGSIVSSDIKNLIMGPYSRLKLAHLSCNRITGTSAIITSLLKECIVANTVFDGLSISRSLFSTVAFINVVFHRCNFSNSVFKNCSFHGCTFNRCTFRDYREERVPFVNCNFKPIWALGCMVSNYGKFKQYANLQFYPNRCHKCTGALLLNNCIGAKDGFLMVTELHDEFEKNLSLSGPADEDQEEKCDAWFNGMGGWQGPEDCSDKYKEKKSPSRGYRFFTTGVKDG